MDKLTDPIDIASGLSETLRAQAEAEQRLKAQPKQVKDADGKWPETDCEDCGEPIGEKRLEATGALDCIECASRKEKRGKYFGKH